MHFYHSISSMPIQHLRISDNNISKITEHRWGRWDDTADSLWLYKHALVVSSPEPLWTRVVSSLSCNLDLLLQKTTGCRVGGIVQIASRQINVYYSYKLWSCCSGTYLYYTCRPLFPKGSPCITYKFAGNLTVNHKRASRAEPRQVPLTKPEVMQLCRSIIFWPHQISLWMLKYSLGAQSTKASRHHHNIDLCAAEGLQTKLYCFYRSSQIMIKSLIQWSKFNMNLYRLSPDPFWGWGYTRLLEYWYKCSLL